MRNGTHYVQVRVTPDMKARFIAVANTCKIRERAVLYHLVNGNVLAEHPPEEFGKLNRILTRIPLLIGQIWLNKNIRSETLRQKYYTAEKLVNKSCVSVLRKIIFANPYYGEDNNKRKD